MKTARKRRSAPQARSIAKRALILEASTRHFAEHGFANSRAEDIAAKLKIAKGSIFQHFKSKEGLFFEAYKKAVLSLPAYLDAPQSVKEKGYFETVRYWLTRTEEFMHKDWVPFRIAVLGDYGTDVKLRRDIERFLADNDPYGSTAFVRWGIERGEVRDDIDVEMLVYTMDWMTERFQDALMNEELDPGLFRKQGSGKPLNARPRIEQFLTLLRGAIGAGRAAASREAGRES